MRILKYVLYGLSGIVLLVVLAIVAALVIVDGNFVKNRLERMQYRPELIDGFLAQTGLSLEAEPP